MPDGFLLGIASMFLDPIEFSRLYGRPGSRSQLAEAPEREGERLLQRCCPDQPKRRNLLRE